MKAISAPLMLLAVLSWDFLLAGQAQRRYPVDPETKWAVGAKQKPADELKSQLDAGKKVLIIDVRRAESFNRETLPGAINIPFGQLEEHLTTIPKDATLVFT